MTLFLRKWRFFWRKWRFFYFKKFKNNRKRPALWRMDRLRYLFVKQLVQLKDVNPEGMRSLWHLLQHKNQVSEEYKRKLSILSLWENTVGKKLYHRSRTIPRPPPQTFCPGRGWQGPSSWWPSWPSWRAAGWWCCTWAPGSSEGRPGRGKETGKFLKDEKIRHFNGRLAM